MCFILTRNRSAMLKTELISLSMKTAASQHLPCATFCVNYSALTWEEAPVSTAHVTTGFPNETACLAGFWVFRMGTSPFRHWLILRLISPELVGRSHKVTGISAIQGLDHGNSSLLGYLWRAGTCVYGAIGVVQLLGSWAVAEVKLCG